MNPENTTPANQVSQTAQASVPKDTMFAPTARVYDGVQVIPPYQDGGLHLTGNTLWFGTTSQQVFFRYTPADLKRVSATNEGLILFPISGHAFTVAPFAETSVMVGVPAGAGGIGYMAGKRSHVKEWSQALKASGFKVGSFSGILPILTGAAIAVIIIIVLVIVAVTSK